nr:putative reverse transcriptase domain-containing protein [Tanacetum cinerariifolium]
MFDDDQFEEELEMEDDAFVLIGKEVAPNSEIPETMFPLLKEFSDIFPDELPDVLPPLCDIQHHIDLEPDSQLPNMSHDRMSPEEHEELRRQELRLLIPTDVVQKRDNPRIDVLIGEEVAEDELEMEDDAFVLIGKEVAPHSEIPETMFPLLKEFSDIFPDELPDALPPLCDIQHHIDLEPDSQLPN